MSRTVRKSKLGNTKRDGKVKEKEFLWRDNFENTNLWKRKLAKKIAEKEIKEELKYVNSPIQGQ